MDFSLPLSIEDAALLIGVLNLHVDRWRRHYDADGGQTHTPEEWEEVRTDSGHLIWRLEQLAVLPGHSLSHSQYAVRPPEDGEEDGGAGVSEPRRPHPSAPSTAESYGE